MAAWRAALLFGLVLAAAAVAPAAAAAAADADDDYADEERAHLVVRKFVSGGDQPEGPTAVVGRNLTVTVELFNAGNA